MGFFEEAEKFSKAVVEKGKEIGKVAKKQIDIATMESQINDCKKKIGNIVYKEKIKVKNEDIKKSIEKINKLMKDIEKLKINNL